MPDKASPPHGAGARPAGFGSAGQPGATPATNASDDQTSPSTTIAVWAALVAVAGLVGLVVLSVVASTVVVFFFSSSQPPCVDPLGAGTSADGDSSVPLPAVNPAARLQVRIVSWNTHTTNSTTNVVRGFQAIEAAGGDVVGLQEAPKNAKGRDMRRRLASTWGFTSAEGPTPIAWRKADYELLAQGRELAFKSSSLENGAAGTHVGPKWVEWAELRDVDTRATFILINDHKPPSVTNGGHPDKKRPKGVALWRKQDRAVGRVIDQLKPLGVPIFKTGDENVGAKGDAKVRDPGFPYVQMQKRGMYSNWRVLGYPKQDTHGGGLIDYVWALTKLAAPVRQQIGGTYGSDHRMVLVDLDNAKAVGTAPTTQASITTKPVAKAAAGSTTNPDEKAVWRALRATGFDTIHAAAAMGNMQDESGFDPQIIQGGGHSARPAAAGRGGYGLVQWTPGRKLSDYIGSATPTVENEVAALKAQLDGKGPHPENAAGDAFWAATDTATAARVFHLRYERSASKDSSHRVSNALDIERRLQSTPTAGDVQAAAPCPASNAPDAAVMDGGTRVVTDPTSHKTYRVAVPAGPRGVAIGFALDQLGKPYVWGGHGPDVYDCSGLVSAAWAKAGVHFTPQTEAMYRELPHVGHPQPGDLTYHPGHTQMVLNDGLILEAPRTGLTVRIIDENWMKPTAWFDPTQMK